MIISNIKLNQSSSSLELSASVSAKNHCNFPEILWFRFPKVYYQHIGLVGNPFVPAMLALCMVLGEPLKIDAPISFRLLANIEQIQDILSLWLAEARKIPVEVPNATTIKNPPGLGVGSFFSCGIDSFHSLLKNNTRITHLLLIRGFDRALNNDLVFQNTFQLASRVAKQEAKELILFETNLRKFSDQLIPWNNYFGMELAAVGLILSNLFETIIIPSSEPYKNLKPSGSHPLLDYLWSLESTTFEHDGCETLRSEKVINWICNSPLALETLRVCWEKAENGNNCGHCEKCIRTMLALLAGGKLDQCTTFSTILTPQIISELKLLKYHQIQFAIENLNALKRSKAPQNLIRALERTIQRGLFRYSLRILRGKPF